MPRRPMSATEAREKHATRLKNSVTEIERGVNSVQTAPGELAAAQSAKMKANLIASIDNGKWSTNVAAVTLTEWKRAMIEKGVPNIANGIDNASSKMEDFYGKLFDHIDRTQTAIDAMPTTTASQSKAKMNANFDRMSNFSYQR